MIGILTMDFYFVFFCILILISDFVLAVIEQDGRFQF